MFLQFGSGPMSHLQVVKHKGEMFGFQHDHKTYVIGFNDKQHARKFKKYVSKYINITLIRENTRDITTEINASFISNNEPDMVVDRVTLDLHSKLIVGKKFDNLFECDVEEYDYEDFTSLPCKKRLGIAIPMELTWEDRKNFRIFYNNSGSSISIQSVCQKSPTMIFLFRYHTREDHHRLHESCTPTY